MWLTIWCDGNYECFYTGKYLQVHIHHEVNLDIKAFSSCAFYLVYGTMLTLPTSISLCLHTIIIKSDHFFWI